MDERDQAIEETVASLIPRFLEMRKRLAKRGINIRLKLPDGYQLQASVDGKNWANVDDDYDWLDVAPHVRLSYMRDVLPEATIKVQFLSKDVL